MQTQFEECGVLNNHGQGCNLSNVLQKILNSENRDVKAVGKFFRGNRYEAECAPHL